MNEADIKRQVASLNTQLRFGRHDGALTEAYKLRSGVQLSGLGSREILAELQRAERIIERLESSRLVGIQKLVGMLVGATRAAMNPEDDKESTLLDDFSPPQTEEESWDEELESVPTPVADDVADTVPEEYDEPEIEPPMGKPVVSLQATTVVEETEDEQDWGWGSH